MRIVGVAAGVFRDDLPGRGRGKAACASFFDRVRGEGDRGAVHEHFRAVRIDHRDHRPVFPAIRGLAEAVLDADGVGAGRASVSSARPVQRALFRFRSTDGLSVDSGSHSDQRDGSRETECVARGFDGRGLDLTRGSQNDVHGEDVLLGHHGPSDGGSEAQHLEGGELRDLRGCSRTRVGDPDVGKARREELLPGFLFHDAVGGVDADFRRARFLERLRAFDERAAGVDQVVNDDDLPSRDLALADRDLPRLTVPDLPADDEGEEGRPVLIGEHGLEPLPRALVGEDDRNVFSREPLLQEFGAGLELRRDVLSEVVPNGQGVHVPEIERDGSRTRRRHRRDHLCERGSRSDLSFVIDPLHRPGGEVGEEDLERLGPQRRERVDRAHLFEDRAERVEAGEKRDVRVLNRVNVVDERVGIAVRESLPGNLPDRDPRVVGRHRFGDALHGGTREQNVGVHVNLSSVVNGACGVECS